VGDYSWIHDLAAVDMDELSTLYRIAPLGDKPPEALATVFGNSMFMCFLYVGDVLVGAGRVLADGLDRAYVADVVSTRTTKDAGSGRRLSGSSWRCLKTTRRSSCTPTRGPKASTAS
jgi:hypothetical protein